MIEITLVFGGIIFLGLAMILAKLPLRTTLWLLGHSVWVDLGVSVLVLWMHWGTMTGLMSATVAGLICALATGIAKRLVGHVQGNMYYPGILNLTNRLLRRP